MVLRVKAMLLVVSLFRKKMGKDIKVFTHLETGIIMHLVPRNIPLWFSRNTEASRYETLALEVIDLVRVISTIQLDET